jgi:hypothetical protein
MSFISKENQTTLWNVIQKIDLLHNTIPQSEQMEWFKEIVSVQYNKYLNIKYDIKQLNKDTISLMINSLTHHNIQRQEQPKFSESINDSVIENMDELLEQQVRQRELDLTISQPKQDFTKEIAELAELRQTVQTLRIELERLKSSSV